MELPLLIVVSSLLFALVAAIAVVIRCLSQRRPAFVRYESEKYFLDPKTSTKHLFPNLLESRDSVYISVVIPAYNEEKRLPIMLDEAIDYLERRSHEQQSSGTDLPTGSRFSYEIIIVDDGSNDKTTEVGHKYSLEYGCDKVRVLTLEENRGKGGAVRLGMLSARGKLLLLADADGATLFKDIERLESFLYKSSKSEKDILHSLAIGSRKHLEDEAKAKRSFFRTLLMIGFHFLVWFFTVKTIRDTQCGFKMFGRQVAKVLFPAIHVERWAFDVELLLLAERLNIRMGEIPVTWTEIEGSKIIPVFSWLQMGKDVILVSLMYTIKAWDIPNYRHIYN
ncbi:dolichyl-phosphate beta-glucosyltransferase-like protein [Dinothrombium tinctorium]|uniref:dolichyl-phosphate beta-glucosyltransferase n=1 Tax=Dinothrombium tinctorium TaxID=1965070 RepID=A0A3S3P2C3_9ACAR|nr:dolichyl-phosphate beta-glucosyltransferase-like protein [Dinothrombium tinctorium]RWS06571.1 dolichyl-phosphate beta-glucosyltransferase-like protein [Dinothrombium tinctorium]